MSKYTGTDSRGRRTTQSDSRVGEGAKAELPAYGFNNMTLGDIMDERKRVDQERNKDNTSGTSSFLDSYKASKYKKGGKVTRGDGVAQRGKTKGVFK